MSKPMPRVSGASLWLPEDMVAEILSWLPVKSLLRFKCVCKKWRQFIQQDDDFVQKHHRRAATCCYYQNKYINQFCLRIMRFSSRCIDIEKGLVLEHEHEGHKDPMERLRIRNPVTRQTVYLPDLRVGDDSPTWVVARMFFIAKSNNKCKVISFSESEESVLFGRFRAVTVGFDAAWRPLRNSQPNSIHCIISNACWKPTIYALSIENIFYVVVTNNNRKKILWVNSEDESIKTAKVPENLFSDWKYVMPREWNSKLSLFCNERDQINIWILMNNSKSKNEWAKTQSVDVANFTVDYPIPFITKEKKVWMRGINRKRWRVFWCLDLSVDVPWFKMDELSIKPTVLQLKGMQSNKVEEEEAIGARFWKERDMPTTTSQIISAISVAL